MRQPTADACRPYANRSNRAMIRRIVTCAAVSLWIGLAFNGLVAEAATLPPVDELMKELKLSDRDREKVRHGEIVDWSPSEGSDRELALGMVFLVKAKKEDLFEIYRQAMVLREVSVITAHGSAENAVAALKAGDTDGAARYCRRALKIDPTNLRAARAMAS